MTVLRPFPEKTSRKYFAGREQLVPVRQTGEAGEIRTTPASPDAAAAPELCAPQAVAARRAARIVRARVITAIQRSSA
jgi:hypothetical protein